MRISTLKGVFYFSFISFVLVCQNTSAATYYAVTGGNWNTSIWSSTANGSVDVDIAVQPADDVVINDDITVNIVSNVVCKSLTVRGALNIISTNSLLVSVDVILDQGIFSVGNGYFNGSGDMHVIANGNDDVSLFTVGEGMAVVSGSIYFWKDKINGATNGSSEFRLLKISSSGTITLGGTLVGANGTDSQTLAQTAPSTFIFKGGTNSNYWNYPGNWSGGKIPTIDDDIFIPLNLTARLETDQAVKTIKMYSGSAIDLSSKFLTVSGDIHNDGGNIYGSSGGLKFNQTAVDQAFNSNVPITIPNIEINKAAQKLQLNCLLKISEQVSVPSGTLTSDGNLTLLSTASKSANIGPLINGADVAGNVNVQVFLTGGYRGYKLMSSPINDAALAEKTFKQLKKFIIITGPGGTGNGFDQGGNVQPESPSLNLYNETTGARQASTTAVQNINQFIAPGIGFYAFFRGKQMGSYTLNSPKLNAPFVSPEDVIITLTGPINKFNQVAVPLSNSLQPEDIWNGYNLIGNPYPSTIDYEKIPRGVSISDQLITLKPNGSAASYKSNPKVINNGGNQYIQPGQAFFLVANSNTTVSFQESQKAVSIYPSGFLSSPKEQLSMASNSLSTIMESPLIKVMKLNLQDELNSDEATIVFQEGRSANADYDDVLYFSGSSVSLSSISVDNKKLAINIMPAIKEIKEIKLSVNSTLSGLVKLNFSDLSGAEGYQVLLKDALLPDSLFDVKTKPVYAFNIDKANYDTYGNDRFSLIFKPEPIAAPFLFTAARETSGVELNWVSNIATKIDYFEVEVSTDLVVYFNIGKIKNAGNSQNNSQFSFIDKSPPAGIRFYRLKQFNNDGSVTYTDLRKVDLLTLASDVKVSVYPNPAIDKIQISLPSRPEGNIDAVVFNRLGQPVKNLTFFATDDIAVNLTNWVRGVYFLELRRSGTKELIGHSKFVVGQ